MPIKSWRTGWIFGCCLFIWISCNRTGNDNPRLEKALSLSGSNRQELEKVLHHFSQNPSDSLYAYSGGYPFSISGDIRSLPS